MRFSVVLLLAVARVMGLKVPEKDFTDRQYFVVELDTLVSLSPLSSFISNYNELYRFEHPARGLDDHFVFSIPKTHKHMEFLGNLNSNEHNYIKRSDGLEAEYDEITTFPDLKLIHMLYPKTLERRLPVFIDEPMTLGQESLSKELLRRLDIVDSSQAPAKEVSDKLGIEDPIFLEQWHLVNTQYPGHDVNVKNVWYNGIRGKGVTVAIIDDGLDYDSPDLLENFSKEGLWDFNNNEALPKPRLFDDYHGTRCAGEVAAVKNDVCGIGVAYEGKVSGIRILSGAITSEEEAAAMIYGLEHNDIYSCSWGPTDNGRTVAAPDSLVKKAMIKGVQEGRKNKGAIYVFASGNGGRVGDQCNFDGYTNSIYSITVGAIDYKGLHPSYAETCSAVMVVTYSSGSGEHIHTTDIHNKCSALHGGTSAAAPLAAGIYALVLQANPELTWRDTQYVSAMAAVPINEGDGEYQMTALGQKYSNKYGFGKIDAEILIKQAQEWKNVKPQAWHYSDVQVVDKKIDAKPGQDSGVITNKAEKFDLDKDYAKIRRDRVSGGTTPTSSSHLASFSSSSASSSISVTAGEPSLHGGSTALSELSSISASAIGSVPSRTSLISSSTPSEGKVEEPDAPDGHDGTGKHYSSDHMGQYFMLLAVLGFIFVLAMMKWHRVQSSSRRRRGDFEFDIIPGEDYSDSEEEIESYELQSPSQQDLERERLFDDFNADSLPEYDDDAFQVGMRMI
ncbi:hypothetical protein HF325_006421 [Metschnikowia pulcherrima]|uniref:Peptidase S8/S53 domain-containing protein n=1 Tax=Metschnikowia pulcherrima TaxID=27326 RepID=A0A8H7L8D3_9ASCO|nr:hypothetical protein HF325_006421 [Metschnikowia pulcherrima]